MKLVVEVKLVLPNKHKNITLTKHYCLRSNLMHNNPVKLLKLTICCEIKNCKPNSLKSSSYTKKYIRSVSDKRLKEAHGFNLRRCRGPLSTSTTRWLFVCLAKCDVTTTSGRHVCILLNGFCDWYIAPPSVIGRRRLRHCGKIELVFIFLRNVAVHGKALVVRCDTDFFT